MLVTNTLFITLDFVHVFPGDCVREDRRVDSELPEPDDFIFALFEEFADSETCLIYEEGTK